MGYGEKDYKTAASYAKETVEVLSEDMAAKAPTENGQPSLWIIHGEGIDDQSYSYRYGREYFADTDKAPANQAAYAQFAAIESAIEQVGAENVILTVPFYKEDPFIQEYLSFLEETGPESAGRFYIPEGREVADGNQVLCAMNQAHLNGVEIVPVMQNGSSVNGLNELGANAQGKIIIHHQVATHDDSYELFGYKAEEVFDSMHETNLDKFLQAIWLQEERDPSVDEEISIDPQRNPFKDTFARTTHVNAWAQGPKEREILQNSRGYSNRETAASFNIVSSPENVALQRYPSADVIAANTNVDEISELIRLSILEEKLEDGKSLTEDQQQELNGIKEKFDLTQTEQAPSINASAPAM